MFEKFVKKDTRESHEDIESLTIHKAWVLFYNSFLFSQGSQDLQKEIFSWLHHKHPYWKMDDGFVKKLTDIAEKKIPAFFASPGKHVTLTEGEKAETHTVINAMQRIFNTAEAGLITASELEEMLEGIALEVISLDYKYLITRNGRKRPVVSGLPISPQHDPFLSHLAFYGFESGSHVPEFREMWEDIVRCLRKRIKEKEFQESSSGSNLRAVIGKYETTHPGKKIEF